MTPNGLGLDTANPSQGLELIPAGTEVTLVTKIRPGNVGIEGMLKRTSKGDAEMLDVEFVVRGGPYDKRKIYDNMILDGTTAGHAKAGEISRSKLRAILEATHAIDPNDTSAAATAQRASATLASFSGATFLATVEVEPGGKKPDGSSYKDKNTIGKILRVGDQGYRRLDQPPPAPVDRPSSPPNGSPAAAAATVAQIAKPSWAE